MIPIGDLFEAHLTERPATLNVILRWCVGIGTCSGLSREKGRVPLDRRRRDSMLGLWEVGAGPQRLSLHLAFRVDLDHLLQAPGRLRAANMTPLELWEKPTDESVVFAWMPASSLFFHAPDGNLLEFLSMLPDAPQSDLGVVGSSE